MAVTGGGRNYSGSIWQGNATVQLDLGDLRVKISTLKEVLSQDNFNRLMYRTFGEVARKSKTLIAREVVKDYAVPQSWVKKGIDRYQLKLGHEVTCVIPLNGVKGVHGARFRAHMLKKGRVSSKVLRMGTSKLPPKMERQGGNPPFINTNSAKLNGIVVTRRTSERFPLVRVVGLSVPQMPLNRSEDKMWDTLLDYTGKRLERNMANMFNMKLG